MPTSLVLESLVATVVEAPVEAVSAVVPIHVITTAVPTPTLVDGRPS